MIKDNFDIIVVGPIFTGQNIDGFPKKYNY